jgi:hypothetical protein
MDPYYVPLKPFKEGLQRCPLKLSLPHLKNGRIMLPKNPLNRLGIPKYKRLKTSPKSA